MASPVVERVARLFLEDLKRRDSPLLSSLSLEPEDPASRDRLMDLLRLLAEKPLDQALAGRPDLQPLAKSRESLFELVEGFLGQKPQKVHQAVPRSRILGFQ